MAGANKDLPVVREGLVDEEQYEAVEDAALAAFAALRAKVTAKLRAQATGPDVPASTRVELAESHRRSSPQPVDWSVDEWATDPPGFDFVDVLSELDIVHLLSGDFIDTVGDVVLDASAGARIAIGFDVSDPALERIVNEHLAAVGHLAPLIERAVGRWVGRGLFEGASIEDMVADLTAHSPLSESSARSLARTEAVAAANAGSLASWQASDIGGFKRWISAHDSRVRPDHVDADGQTVPLNDPFVVCSGEQADYPGDPALSPGCRIQCRCTQIFLSGDGDIVKIPHTRAELQGLATQRGLSAGGSNAQLRQRLLNAIPDVGQRLDALESLSRNELLDRASSVGIKGRHRMNKDELRAALAAKGAFVPTVGHTSSLTTPWKRRPKIWPPTRSPEAPTEDVPAHHGPPNGRLLPAEEPGALIAARFLPHGSTGPHVAVTIEAAVGPLLGFPIRHDPATGRFLPEGASGGAKGSGALGYGDLMAKLAEPDGGFTMAQGGRLISTGFAVSPYPQRSRGFESVDALNEDDVVDYITDNLSTLREPGHHFGGWHDPDTGRVYLDVSIVTATAAEAERVALERDQLSYFDFAAGTSVTVNPAATSGGQASMVSTRPYTPPMAVKHVVSAFDPGAALDEQVEAAAEAFEALTGRVADRDRIRARLLEHGAAADESALSSELIPEGTPTVTES